MKPRPIAIAAIAVTVVALLLVAFRAPIRVAVTRLAGPEEACLDSLRLSLKDPDSAKVVSNLKSRGLDLPDGAFFLRYKATNSYGAYVSSNTICSVSYSGAYEAGGVQESIVRTEIGNLCLQAQLSHLRAGQEWKLGDCDHLADAEFKGIENLRWLVQLGQSD